MGPNTALISFPSNGLIYLKPDKISFIFAHIHHKTAYFRLTTKQTAGIFSKQRCTIMNTQASECLLQKMPVSAAK